MIDNPLTKRIAVTRFRKYITKEEYQLPLFDLLSSITEDTYKRLFTYDFPRPTNDAVKTVIELYCQQLNTLASLFVEGFLWINSSQIDFLEKSMRRIASPPDKSNSYVIWGTVPYFPAFMLFYIAGITCVSKNDFTTLARLLKIDIPDKYQGEVNILAKLIHYNVLEDDQLKSIYGKNHHVPMSELLYKELRQYFMIYIPIDSEYDNYFNYFELVVALYHKKTFPGQYPPMGRFSYKLRQDYYLKKKIAMSEQQLDNFELVKAGLFDNYDAVRDSLKEIQQLITKYYR